MFMSRIARPFRSRKARVWLRRAPAVLLAALLIAIPFGSWLVVAREIADPDALLVLASHEHERLPHAARLARRWPGARVLLTQPVTPTPYNCQDCGNRPRTLVAAGVEPARLVVLDRHTRTSFDELAVAGAWARRTGRTRVLVVTSPYHSRRILVLAPAAAPGVQIGVSPAPVAGGLAWPWWSRRYDRRYVMYEWAALIDNSWRHALGPRYWRALSARGALYWDVFGQ